MCHHNFQYLSNFSSTFHGLPPVMSHMINIITEKKRNFHSSSHCVKSVQIRSFLWSVFSCIWAEYGNLRCISPYLRIAHGGRDYEPCANCSQSVAFNCSNKNKHKIIQREGDVCIPNAFLSRIMPEHHQLY